MSNNFDWQTEETAVWEDDPTPAPPTSPPKRRRRGWLVTAGLLVGLLVIAGWFAWRQLSQRVETTTETLTADVLASARVIEDAAATRDRDLFVTFLSGRDDGWASALEQAVSDGLHDHPQLGLTWLPPTDPISPTMTLSPELNSAELLITRTYAIDVGGGLTETVRLAQTAVYRPGPNRWLLSPPEADYWGDTETVDGHILSLRYPARDAALATRLARDLDYKLLELCARFPDMNCPDDFAVQLVFRPDPITLRNTVQGGAPLILDDTAKETLLLDGMPTPSLLGQPVDEAAYAALLRGYGGRLAAAVLIYLNDADCCLERPFMQAALAVQLEQLALRPWPVTPAQYDATVAEPIAPTGMDRYWRAQEGVAPWPALAFADFLINDQRLLSAAALQASIAAADEADLSFSEWWRATLAPRLPDAYGLEQRWLQYVYGRSRLAQMPLPIPLPAQDLFALCSLPDRINPVLARINVQTGAAAPLTTLAAANNFMLPLPANDGVVVGENVLASGPSGSASLFLWADGLKTALSWSLTGSAPGSLPLALDPAGETLLLGGVVQPFGLLDTAACRRGDDCPLRNIVGAPVWSPDGAHALVIANETGVDEVNEGLIFLGAADGADFGSPAWQSTAVFLANGTSSFWLDETRFGFVRLIPDGENTGETGVYVADVANPEPELLLPASTLLNALPEAERASFVSIDFVAAHPLQPDTLLMATTHALSQGAPSHLFRYDLATETAVPIFTFRNEPRLTARGYRFGPDGRSLAIVSLVEEPAADDDAPAGWRLTLLDLTTYETWQTALDDPGRLPAEWFMDWSADGQWLAIPRDGHLRLIAVGGVEEVSERLLIPDMACAQAVWIDREIDD